MKSSHQEIRVGIVVSDYYQDIAQGLLTGAKSVLDEYSDIKYETIQVFGAWEIALIAKLMAQSNRFQALITLGCIIRGETSHFDHLCHQCSQALMSVSMDYTIPLGFGVLTVENYAQAEHRSGIADRNNNKGCEAAIGVIGSIHAARQIHQSD